WEFRDTSFAVDGTPEEDQIDGKKVKLGLRAGDILWSGSLEKEMAIRRGDPIVVKSGTGMWEVSVNAVAAQDASIGDVISLKQKNGAQLTGMVVGQGEVELR
ncbi:MAG TPA: flagellar basal body P-ring formation chaperone FlgA, partial [Bdellovibrionales bacterium]|nr:flagellar basal body P-ring formation chaperone FlgA [Bdellovibrionales bacterium]